MKNALTVAIVVIIIAVTAWIIQPVPQTNPSPQDPPQQKTAHDQAEQILDELLKQKCRNPAVPWASVHGALVFGKDFKLSDGRSAIRGAIEDFIEEKDGHLSFPSGRNGQPIESHPGLFSKVAVGLGLKLKGLKNAGLTAPRLWRDTIARYRPEAPVHNQEWLLEVIFRKAKPALRKQAGERALTTLERDQAYIQALMKKPGAAERFQKKSKLVGGRRVAAAIHAQYCGGNHLIQATALAVARDLGPEGKRRFEAQMRALIWRLSAEAGYWNRVIMQISKQAPKDSEGRPRSPDLDICMSQKLKFLGHSIESYGLAVKLGAMTPTPADQTAVKAAVQALAEHILQMDSLGVFARLGSYRQDRRTAQLETDLIGDSAHALHGLNLWKTIKPKTSQTK